MPHKHKRKRDDDEAHYELPPTEKARPLTTSKGTLFTADAQKKSTKRKRSNKDDDTPAAFKRLMAFSQGIKPRSGLDNGTGKSGKKGKPVEILGEVEHETVPAPKIRPGERMNDFSARVDAALPLNGLAKKNAILKNADGTRRAHNKAEKRQQNMQKEWREIDARYKERLAEAKEEAEEDYEEIWRGVDDGPKKKRKHSKRAANDDEGDLWASVGKAKETPSTKLVGIHDVVQDVPKFTVAPKEKMKIRHNVTADIRNVPTRSGSLRRREELQGSRRKIIDAYRDLTRRRTGLQNL